MRVYLVCPANQATGGTELIHQFSSCLTANGIENYIIYPDADHVTCPTPPTFRKYGVKYVSCYVDSPDSILVLAETQVHLAKGCQKGTVMIWWLSVDNYFAAYNEQFTDDNYDIFHLNAQNNIIHFVQSYYAQDFVHAYFSKDNCHFLMDYINDDIVNWASEHINSYERKNIIVYNPKKGYAELEPIIQACRKDITWIPLIKMTPTEMADTMCKAKVYIDFGKHPGKDRIPREAATCGCCIITNRKGSAAYDGDVTIPEQYKISDTTDINYVLEKIYDLIDNYEVRTTEYTSYRNKILGEKEEFLRDAQTAIKILLTQVIAKLPNMKTSELTQHISPLSSIASAGNMVTELAQSAQNACHAGDQSQVINDLLTMDYILQLIRESIYSEIIELS